MRRLAVTTLAIFTIMLLIEGSRPAAAAPAKVRAQFRIVEHVLVETAKTTIEQASMKVSVANAKEDSRAPRIYWSNGKQGSAALLNTTMLLKGGALMNFSPIANEKSKMNQEQVRYTPRRWASNGKTTTTGKWPERGNAAPACGSAEFVRASGFRSAVPSAVLPSRAG